MARAVTEEEASHDRTQLLADTFARLFLILAGRQGRAEPTLVAVRVEPLSRLIVPSSLVVVLVAWQVTVVVRRRIVVVVRLEVVVVVSGVLPSVEHRRRRARFVAVILAVGVVVRVVATEVPRVVLAMDVIWPVMPAVIVLNFVHIEEEFVARRLSAHHSLGLPVLGLRVTLTVRTVRVARLGLGLARMLVQVVYARPVAAIEVEGHGAPLDARVVDNEPRKVVDGECHHDGHDAVVAEADGRDQHEEEVGH
mmetsp:Transcript_98985/g.283182  ORF Transcript_98985/g.283182 Transcript_98985/m.283182 type:complete len:252 (-) Transcript_98985:741-1496(-)